MIDETLDLPLEKLVLTPEGCEIFDILCLRLDVNQKYVDLLPQWRDVAHILQLDDLSTKWVEVCVRPREGLTRAMLEIYMKDGGTLGKSRDKYTLWKKLDQNLTFLDTTFQALKFSSQLGRVRVRAQCARPS